MTATTSSRDAVFNSQLSLVCVGTPSNANGSLDLSHIQRVCSEIGTALRDKTDHHVVVMRSTMLPGTLRTVVVPTLEEYSGKKVGVAFDVCVNPEFLREGSSLRDFYAPPFTLVGADSEVAGQMVSALYSEIEASLIVTSTTSAEMVKYACNCFHGVKVGFANEIGNICKALGIDSHEVMEIFCQDKKLNLSPYYLKPGFAFGGSCLPKDLRALSYKAKELDVETPVLSAILPSNRRQVELAIEMVLATGKKQIGILGFSFKAGTDDLRESPMVTLIENLIGKGLKLAIYDRDVSLARLVGANKEYIEREIPHIAELMRQSVADVVSSSEVIIIGNKAEEFREIEPLLTSEHRIIDLVRLFSSPPKIGTYEGICW